ncbi:MAG: ABC transporter ATP-binding protein [Planctomycetota bacterium]|nr:MAG: ABC transporter ATP-binding protein [Planctomycetota bacterium]REJ90930.1 MAG: ABC transporter ATP-binding protein [Planctomycetota bacterium]REK20876.1 MAG: ABC transporter ATP-binding protein [Planctomycetota bacterium]REK32786.1 MAG: ABC transporter ATP-binding protein [Planctomycetota bacterium]
MSFVQIDNLWVSYGSVTAVRGVSFNVPRGEVFGFIGPNGAGKSTTIKVLATLKRPDRGRVTIGGVNVPSNPMQIRRMIGYMPDFFGVYEDLTAGEYLHFYAAAFQIPRSQRDRTVADVLALTDLSEKADSAVDSLSRGMKQRLGLARVLLHDPDLLLLDEPASGLDPRARIEVRELLKALKSMGKTIIVSSHILHELAQLCTRIGIIEAGRMITEGSLEEIYHSLGLLQTVHIQIVNLTDEHVRRIEALPGVEDVNRQVDRLAVRLRAEDIAAEDLLDEIHALGCRIRMFQPEAMDMETAFMKLTQGKTA